MLEFTEIGNPFPGLRPFSTDEYNLFFGREGQSDELLERLRRARFLAVVGTSGSGKSSLVRAGLLPALYGGLMAGTGSGWRVALMRPGGDPVGNLARELAGREVLGDPAAGGGDDAAFRAAVVETTLRRSTLGLVEAVRQARLDAHENLLVVVDQFEELFRFRQARSADAREDDAAAFVKLLLEAARQREVAVYVVLTMRSDFLGDCAQFQGLPEAINAGQYLIPRMTRDERRGAITGPASVGGGEISLPLVNRLLNDVGDNPDQLPILQHALMRTWDYWRARRQDGQAVGLPDYEAIGGMADALSRHADEAFDELTDAGARLLAERMFKALTEKGADNRETRRPTRLAELCAITGASAGEVAAVVERFRGEGRSFLMPPAGVALDADTVVDISHESLIRNWGRLRDWVNEEAQSARIYRRVAEAAALHREGKEGLLADPALQLALDWRDRHEPNRAWGERYHTDFDATLAFLEASRARRDELAAAERERERRELERARAFAEQQARAARRLRWLSFALFFVLLGALATAGYALAQRRQAKMNEARARTNEDVARQSEQKAIQDKRVADEALESKIVAERAQAQAEESEQKAREAEKQALKNALAEKKRAEQQQRIAERSAREAVAARKVAEAEKAEVVRREAQILKSKEANDLFREGVTRAQRGQYDEARSMLSDAVDLYRAPILDNEEAAADSHAQLGNLMYTVGYARFIGVGGDFGFTSLREKVDQLTANFDEAARVYAGPKVRAPEKAGAALYTLGTILQKFTTEVPEAGTKSGARLEALFVPTGLADEAPRLGMDNPSSTSGSDYRTPEGNEKAKIKRQAAERFGKSFEHYRQAREAYERAGDAGGSHRAWEGMVRAAYQAGDLHMREANAIWASGALTPSPASDVPPDPSEANAHWRAAIKYFEELLALHTSVDDRRVARLLVWLGGLHRALEEDRAATPYLKRVLDIDIERAPNRIPKAERLSWMAEVAAEAGFSELAVHYYERALTRYVVEGAGGGPGAPSTTLMQQGDTLYRLGHVYEENWPAGTPTTRGEAPLRAAFDYYLDAIEKYRQAFDTHKSVAHPYALLQIGAFAKGINNYRDALDAYELVVRAREVAKSGTYVFYVAQALAEIGGIHAAEERAAESLAAYEQAAELYRGMPKNPYLSPYSLEEAKDELERIEGIVAALRGTMQKKK